MKYQVLVNGSSVPVHTARVSALPLNKIWDGVQRPLEQTEEAYFVSFDLQDTATMTIEVAEDFSAYEIRPKVFRLDEKRAGNEDVLNITDVKAINCEIPLEIKTVKPEMKQ
ncbi:MAG: hypothetical protein IKJ94_06350 [Oscillospiraceae bacterium]|nr:hypothetical protein [Oscillospiraceae bacterium]